MSISKNIQMRIIIVLQKKFRSKLKKRTFIIIKPTISPLQNLAAYMLLNEKKPLVVIECNIFIVWIFHYYFINLKI